MHVTGEDSSPVIHITISGKNLKIRNFQSGEWNSNWVIADGKIEGKVKATAHYFEEGNVQLTFSKDFTTEFDLSGETEDE